jgi:glucose/arabinose dehydrogenase
VSPGGSAALPAVLLAAALLAGCTSPASDDDVGPRPLPSGAHTGAAITASPSRTPTAGDPRVVETIASGLSVPWGVAFLPDGTALVTERDTARVLAIRDGRVRTVAEISEAVPQGEAGLLGVAVSPSYDVDRAIYLYVTTAEDNRVIRTTYDGSQLGDLHVILSGIPQGFRHDGGRLAFGPDGYLYVSTGETGEGSLAQDLDSLGGKILRITTDGDAAPGNPFGDSPVWSWGHRNVQGLAFDDAGRLWASEFGDSSWDELNLIVPGGNYGWPYVEGTGGQARYVDPLVVWRTSEASPSGLAWLDGRLWLASLRGERLWRIGVHDGVAGTPADFFVGRYGRLRTVVVAPDGNLWVTTSNRDGRGDPAATDDRILEIDPG